MDVVDALLKYMGLLLLRVGVTSSVGSATVTVEASSDDLHMVCCCDTGDFDMLGLLHTVLLLFAGLVLVPI